MQRWGGIAAAGLWLAMFVGALPAQARITRIENHQG
jgi:hypothetical protein